MREGRTSGRLFITLLVKHVLKVVFPLPDAPSRITLERRRDSGGVAWIAGDEAEGILGPPPRPKNLLLVEGLC